MWKVNTDIIIPMMLYVNTKMLCYTRTYTSKVIINTQMLILEYQLKDVYIFIGATNAQKKEL